MDDKIIQVDDHKKAHCSGHKPGLPPAPGAQPSSRKLKPLLMSVGGDLANGSGAASSPPVPYADAPPSRAQAPPRPPLAPHNTSCQPGALETRPAAGRVHTRPTALWSAFCAVVCQLG